MVNTPPLSFTSKFISLQLPLEREKITGQDEILFSARCLGDDAWVGELWVCWGDGVLPGVLFVPWARGKFQGMEGAHFKSRLAVPTQQGPTRTESLRSVSEALILLLADSHQHLPALDHAQTPSPPPSLEHCSQGTAGFAGLQQGRLCTGSCLMSSLELSFWTLPGSGPECGGDFCLSVCCGLSPGTPDA